MWRNKTQKGFKAGNEKKKNRDDHYFPARVKKSEKKGPKGQDLKKLPWERGGKAGYGHVPHLLSKGWESIDTKGKGFRSATRLPEEREEESMNEKESPLSYYGKPPAIKTPPLRGGRGLSHRRRISAIRGKEIRFNG